MKTKQSPFKKILSILSSILIWAVILLASVFVFITLSTTEEGIPNVLGYTLFTVKSDSMKGTTKENFNKGDMIAGKAVSQEQIRSLKEGDIITFWDFAQDESGEYAKILNTHRIIGINNKDDLRNITFTTKGDNNPEQDKEPVKANDIIARFQFKFFIPGTGLALDFLKEPLGFMLCLVIPVFLFFLWRLYKLIVSIIRYTKVKVDDENEETAVISAEDANIVTEESPIQAPSPPENSSLQRGGIEDDGVVSPAEFPKCVEGLHSESDGVVSPVIPPSEEDETKPNETS